MDIVKFFKKKKKKFYVWRRNRHFKLFGKKFIPGAEIMPCDVRNVRRISYFSRQFEKVRHLPGAIVECGVWRGRSLFFLSVLGEGRPIWGFDSFEGFPNPDGGKHDNPEAARKYHFKNTSPEMVAEFIKMSNGPAGIRLIQGYFEDTLPKYKHEIGQVALIHLDVDIYDSYMTCFNNLYDQLIKGGIILFDEYHSKMNDVEWPGAAKAIDEFCAISGQKVEHDAIANKYFIVKR